MYLVNKVSYKNRPRKYETRENHLTTIHVLIEV